MPSIIRHTRKSRQTHPAASRSRPAAGRPTVLKPHALNPRWDADARELWWGEVLVKQFVVPARNQELVLAAFEAAGWPRCILDPLLLDGPMDAHQRLRDVVKRLNNAQRVPLIEFHRDGTGAGLRWDYAPARRKTNRRTKRRP